mmetsp:Transcript_5538/g.10445  ORF Transcript_5538/g.10445 Transcript_5538/m.10445 type:complete len:204 (-) Transcript_5538:814-1425(-)
MQMQQMPTVWWTWQMKRRRLCRGLKLSINPKEATRRKNGARGKAHPRKAKSWTILGKSQIERNISESILTSIRTSTLINTRTRTRASGNIKTARSASVIREEACAKRIRRRSVAVVAKTRTGLLTSRLQLRRVMFARRAGNPRDLARTLALGMRWIAEVGSTKKAAPVSTGGIRFLTIIATSEAVSTRVLKRNGMTVVYRAAT